jgi:hypothetical protein
MGRGNVCYTIDEVVRGEKGTRLWQRQKRARKGNWIWITANSNRKFNRRLGNR